MRISLILLSLSLLAACSVGPKSIPRDQFDYGMAIASAGREQILKNIVGLRYVEAPVFIDVASVINQYSLEGEVSAGVGFGSWPSTRCNPGCRWTARCTCQDSLSRLPSRRR